jgi:hypothetical protein
MKEKFHAFFELAIAIFLDSVLIIFVGFCVKMVKWALENWIFGMPLEKLDNKTILIVYNISEMSIIASFAIYVLLDILTQIRKFIRKK